MIEQRIKAILAALLLSSPFFGVSAMESYLKKTVAIVKKDKIKYEKTNFLLYFDNATIDFMTLRKEGEKALIKEKWGDYRFGLRFGRPPGTNGGWSLWNFFECHVKINGHYKNVPQMFQPENVNLSKLSDGTILAEITSLLSKDAKLGKMTMRFMKFPSHPTWLFMRVRFKNTSLTPWRMTLSAYPGNSNSPKERERWVATRKSKHCLKTKGCSFTPESDALVMFSRYVHEEFGNYIVFEHEKFTKIYMPIASQGTSAQFFPKKGEKEFKFALGYFMNKPLGDELPRFLGETQDNIRKFMDAINWSPQIETARFAEWSEETKKLLKALKKSGKNVIIYESAFAELSNAFNATVAKSDFNSASITLNALSELNEKMANEWLAQFK